MGTPSGRGGAADPSVASRRQLLPGISGPAAGIRGTSLPFFAVRAVRAPSPAHRLSALARPGVGSLRPPKTSRRLRGL